MVALLVGISIMAVALSVALPTWSTLAKREREEELIFRGQQYARAIALFQRRYANAFPPSIDVLVQQKFLRKRFKDPMTPDGEFQVILVGQPIPGQSTPPQTGQPGARGARSALEEVAGRTGGVPGGAQGGAAQPGRGGRAGTIGGTIGGGGIQGVVSRSTATSLRLFNGRNKYSEWAFVALQATTQAGAPNGAQTPDAGRGRRGGGPPARRGGLPGRIGTPRGGN
jgi:type II secretory pathway pseudopilin PulG